MRTRGRTRREFLAGLGRAGLAVPLARSVAGRDARAEAGASAIRPTLRQPEILAGDRLTAGVVGREVWPDRSTSLWTLGGTYPGPTIRVRSGDVFAVSLENRLPEATNLHWHGLVVPSEMDGYPDDVMVPGASRDYVFRVDQGAGTYWYHPHPDRRTGLQVYKGMAGFFVVEDDVERALGLPSGAFDVPLLIQDRRLTRDRSFTYAPTPMDLVSGYLGDSVLVNGTPDARLGVAAGLYRLRLLNGSNARVYRLAFADGRRFQVIAGDGGLLERPVETGALDLGPGERAELLVDFSGDALGGSVLLKSLRFAGGGMGMGSQGVELPVLRFAVERAAEGAAPIPTTLARLERLDPRRALRTRSFVLQMGMPMMFGAFAINGRSFEPARIDFRVPIGELELWEVRSASAEIHPFHVHGSQFQVVSRTSRALGPHELGFKDTVLVWPGETVRLAVRFRGYRGVYVLHCHNLEHEDAGMMSAFEVA